MFVLLLAAVITGSLFTATAATAGPGAGFAPGTNVQFWYTNTGLTTQYLQQLTIDGKIYDFTLGNNTIQEYFYNSADGNYVISVHPQFFGTVIPPDYDEQDYARYIMNITEILVYDTTSSTYVDCFAEGIGIIPVSYALPSPTNPLYLQCMVFSTIADVTTGAKSVAAWNGKPIYLEIPADL
jgi:hypothetical protein